MRQNHTAFFLITALVVLATMLALGVVSLTRSTTELQGSSRSVDTHRAFHLAESAVDAVLVNLQHGQFNNLTIANMVGGSYWATVDPAGGFQYLIHGHGLRAWDQRDVDAVVQLTPKSVFQFSLFGTDQVIISGVAITDSYDSRLGPYNPTAPGQHGDVGTNATNPGGVNISGSIAVNGQVAVGPGVTDPSSVVVTSGGSALITGTPKVVSQPTALFMPPVTVPLGLTCANLTVNSQTTVTLSSAVAQHCFNNLYVSGGGTLTADGPVTVYVTGTFTASGNTVIGIPTNPPAMLLLLVTNQQATLASTLTGSTEFYGGLYAPSATINISGNAQVFGSVTARLVQIASNAQVHYDKALGDLAQPTGLYKTKLLLWRER